MKSGFAYKFKLVLKTSNPSNFELGFEKSKQDLKKLWESIKAVEQRFPSIDCSDVLNDFNRIVGNIGAPVGFVAVKIHADNLIHRQKSEKFATSINLDSNEDCFKEPTTRRKKMGLSNTQISEIEKKLKSSIRGKFENYNPEPAIMPFHTRLLGKDRLALYQFIHSLNTNFGTTIFEPVAAIAAEKNFHSIETSVKSGNQISQLAQAEIQKIMNELGTAKSEPNKSDEIQRIRGVAQEGEMVEIRPTKVDLKLESSDGIFLFDIKTAKPNAGGFKEFKRTLLEWAAVTFAHNPNVNVHTLVAIPYNPYEPQPYQRWTMRGMLDLNHDLKVAEEFWDFLGGEGTYDELLNCFERVGIELRDEIDQYFARFK